MKYITIDLRVSISSESVQFSGWPVSFKKKQCILFQGKLSIHSELPHASRRKSLDQTGTTCAAVPLTPRGTGTRPRTSQHVCEKEIVKKIVLEHQI